MKCQTGESPLQAEVVDKSKGLMDRILGKWLIESSVTVCAFYWLSRPYTYGCDSVSYPKGEADRAIWMKQDSLSMCRLYADRIEYRGLGFTLEDSILIVDGLDQIEVKVAMSEGNMIWTFTSKTYPDSVEYIRHTYRQYSGEFPPGDWHGIDPFSTGDDQTREKIVCQKVSRIYPKPLHTVK